MIAEFHLIVHPPKGGSGVSLAGRTHGLSRQVEIVDQRFAVPYQIVHHLINERTTKVVNGLLDGGHGSNITRFQGATDGTVMGKSRLAPSPRHDHIRGNRVRPIIQLDQMF